MILGDARFHELERATPTGNSITLAVSEALESDRSDRRPPGAMLSGQKAVKAPCQQESAVRITDFLNGLTVAVTCVVHVRSFRSKRRNVMVAALARV